MSIESKPAPAPTYQPAPRNGFGTAALVLGIVGLLFSFIPIIGVIAWPMVILGLVFAGLGWQRTRNGEATNLGVVIAGGVTSALGLVVCVLYVLLFAASVASAQSAAPAVSTYPTRSVPVVSTQPAPATSPGTLGAGTYVVGTDIAPGTYHTAGPAAGSVMPMCTWSRNKDTSGEFSSIIANHVTQGPDTMTVKSGDGAVQFVGDCNWTLR